ncbi:MAG: hypothetical protein ABJG68_01600 [Crocinitomicaceae bacterium]
MSESKKYSFETPRRNIIWRLSRVGTWIKTLFVSSNQVKEDIDEFYQRFGIPDKKTLNKKERYALKSFTAKNLYNIYWYTKRIRKEQRKLNRYYAYTLIILLGVPIFIFVSTAKASVNSGMPILDQLMAENELKDIITIVVTSLLTLHAFISGWMDQRKIVVEFSKASVELKRIYYQIEALHFDNATGGTIGFVGQAEGQQLSDEFLLALQDGTVLSQRIEDEETKKYYELRAQPTFDIRSIWQNSAAGAKTALSLFKSSKFDPEATKKKALTHQEKLTTTEASIDSKENYLENTALKIKQSRKKLEKLSIKLDELEAAQSTQDGLTEQQQTLLFNYEEQFRQLDEATEALEEEYERVQLEIKLLSNEMEELRRV